MQMYTQNIRAKKYLTIFPERYIFAALFNILSHSYSLCSMRKVLSLLVVLFAMSVVAPAFSVAQEKPMDTTATGKKAKKGKMKAKKMMEDKKMEEKKMEEKK
jgi:cytochrome c biogenesis protein ResB